MKKKSLVKFHLPKDGRHQKICIITRIQIQIEIQRYLQPIRVEDIPWRRWGITLDCTIQQWVELLRIINQRPDPFILLSSFIFVTLLSLTLLSFCCAPFIAWPLYCFSSFVCSVTVLFVLSALVSALFSWAVLTQPLVFCLSYRFSGICGFVNFLHWPRLSSPVKSGYRWCWCYSTSGKTKPFGRW